MSVELIERARQRARGLVGRVSSRALGAARPSWNSPPFRVDLSRWRRPAETPASLGPYEAALARTRSEIRSAQNLRFLVFNLELNEGLEQSFHTCLDEDPYDAVCDHLLVRERGSGDVVGTYRLQTGDRAMKRLGFYSQQEFELEPLRPFRRRMVELGRACIHRSHRNYQTLTLLWRGIARYALRRNARYLVGCSSLSSVDPRVGSATYAALAPRLAPAPWRVRPQPSFACPLEPADPSLAQTPRLLRAYLALGANICGPPAIDREFGTIDFLTVLDLENAPRAQRILAAEEEAI